MFHMIFSLKLFKGNQKKSKSRVTFSWEALKRIAVFGFGEKKNTCVTNPERRLDLAF